MEWTPGVDYDENDEDDEDYEPNENENDENDKDLENEEEYDNIDQDKIDEILAEPIENANQGADYNNADADQNANENQEVVVENVEKEEENIVSDVNDQTLEEIIQDDETQASESSRPQCTHKGVDRFVSYKEKFSKH